MSKIQIVIPDTVRFADLKLSFEQGAVSFDWTPIEIICGHNGLSADIFKAGPEDNVSTLIVHWYAEHLAAGGEPDPVVEEYFAEVMAED
jgi:hypothetical protein